jgi:peptidoglycan L-alanyl-D-glutamate endopeptidase CwlK
MTFSLGRKSLAELQGVHPDMVAVVRRAIRLTTQDFAVHDGIRTIQEQREYVRRGASKTMNSKHLTQKDGYGHAVDLVPYINGQLRWEWRPIYAIAEAMRTAAGELGVVIHWGGFKGFARLTGTTGRIVTHTGWDGPHFELGPRYRA